MHDINVIGTLQLLAACERVPTLRTIVVRGSAGVYGAEPQAPQFFKEEMARLFPLRTRFQRDVAEIENYFETYARRHEGVDCTMLRYQPAIGPGLRTQITRYLSQPVCPTFMGFDPRIQLVHIDDALEAIVAAVRNPVRGAVNVAGPGTIGLARMIRLAGKRAAADRRAAVRRGHVDRPAARPRHPVRRLPAAAPLRARRGHAQAHGRGRLHAAALDGGRGGELGRDARGRPREPGHRDRASCGGCGPGSTPGSSCPRRSPGAPRRSRATRARPSSGSSTGWTATTRRTSGASTRTSPSWSSRSSRSCTSRGGG